MGFSMIGGSSGGNNDIIYNAPDFSKLDANDINRVVAVDNTGVLRSLNTPDLTKPHGNIGTTVDVSNTFGDLAMCKLADNTFLYVYRTENNSSSTIYAKVITINGGSTTSGTEVQLMSSISSSYYCGIYLYKVSDTKVVVMMNNGSYDGGAYVKVLTISGTTTTVLSAPQTYLPIGYMSYTNAFFEEISPGILMVGSKFWDGTYSNSKIGMMVWDDVNNRFNSPNGSVSLETPSTSASNIHTPISFVKITNSLGLVICYDNSNVLCGIWVKFDIVAKTITVVSSGTFFYIGNPNITTDSREYVDTKFIGVNAKEAYVYINNNGIPYILKLRYDDHTRLGRANSASLIPLCGDSGISSTETTKQVLNATPIDVTGNGDFIFNYVDSNYVKIGYFSFKNGCLLIPKYNLNTRNVVAVNSSGPMASLFNNKSPYVMKLSGLYNPYLYGKFVSMCKLATSGTSIVYSYLTNTNVPPRFTVVDVDRLLGLPIGIYQGNGKVVAKGKATGFSGLIPGTMFTYDTYGSLIATDNVNEAIGEAVTTTAIQVW